MSSNSISNNIISKTIDLVQQSSPPSTPKKKSFFKEYQTKNKSEPKIKYRYVIVEKPTNTFIAKISFAVWITILLGCIWLSYQTKIMNLQTSIQEYIKKCQIDFQVNKCDKPVKGVKQYCAEKQKCMRIQTNEQVKLRTQSALFFGELLREFLEGLGLPIFIIGLIYMLIAGRKSQQTRKEFVEYYP